MQKLMLWNNAAILKMKKRGRTTSTTAKGIVFGLWNNEKDEKNSEVIATTDTRMICVKLHILFHYILFQVRSLHCPTPCLLSHQEQGTCKALCNNGALSSFCSPVKNSYCNLASYWFFYVLPSLSLKVGIQKCRLKRVNCKIY